jgi:hypothetical protein
MRRFHMILICLLPYLSAEPAMREVMPVTSGP